MLQTVLHPRPHTGDICQQLAEKRCSRTAAFTPETTLRIVQAPEVIQRKGTGCASDWWGLGVLVFEMLTGDPPFKAVSSDPYDTFRRALAGNFTLPDCLSPEACDLISSLLQVPQCFDARALQIIAAVSDWKQPLQTLLI